MRELRNQTSLDFEFEILQKTESKVIWYSNCKLEPKWSHHVTICSVEEVWLYNARGLWLWLQLYWWILSLYACERLSRPHACFIKLKRKGFKSLKQHLWFCCILKMLLQWHRLKEWNTVNLSLPPHHAYHCSFDQEVKADCDINRHLSRIRHRKPLHRGLKVLSPIVT